VGQCVDAEAVASLGQTSVEDFALDGARQCDDASSDRENAGSSFEQADLGVVQAMWPIFEAYHAVVKFFHQLCGR
jgi:hypothetical protein